MFNSQPDALLNITSKTMTSPNNKDKVNYHLCFITLMETIDKTNITHCPQKDINNRFKEVQKSINSEYERYFFSCLEEKKSNMTGGRFNLYTKIKHSYHYEKYLLLDNKMRHLITSLQPTISPLSA